MFKCQYMCSTQVKYMYIISDTSSIRRIVVCAKNSNEWPDSFGSFQYKRDQMSFRIMVFSDFSIFGCPAGIKISKEDVIQSIGSMVVLNNFLKHQFALSIRVDWILRMALI